MYEFCPLAYLYDAMVYIQIPTAVGGRGTAVTIGVCAQGSYVGLGVELGAFNMLDMCSPLRASYRAPGFRSLSQPCKPERSPTCLE